MLLDHLRQSYSCALHKTCQSMFDFVLVKLAQSEGGHQI